MAQRLVRATRKIREARIPYRVPQEADLPVRLHAVLVVVHLIHIEGHSATSGTELVRAELCAQAVRLARLLARLLVRLVPDEPEALGLLGLLLLSESRRPAPTRLDQGSGPLVTLPEQDRSRWDSALITEGQELVRCCLRRGRPGPVPLPAAVAAVHADAATQADTDWVQVLALYDHLLALDPTPVVALDPSRRPGGGRRTRRGSRRRGGPRPVRLRPLPRRPRRPAAPNRPAPPSPGWPTARPSPAPGTTPSGPSSASGARSSTTDPPASLRPTRGGPRWRGVRRLLLDGSAGPRRGREPAGARRPPSAAGAPPRRQVDGSRTATGLPAGHEGEHQRALG